MKPNNKKPFNPKEWKGKSEPPNPSARASSPVPTEPQGSPISPNNDIETTIQKIEAARADIAPTYDDWCRLGFALAHELGETGREYFLRLSRLHPDCTEKAAQKQRPFQPLHLLFP